MFFAKFRSLALASFALGLVPALSGCNSSDNNLVSGNSLGSIAAQPTKTTSTTPAPVTTTTTDPSTAPTGPAPIGATCHSGDSNKICLSLRFVVYKNTAGTPIMSSSTALADLASMNQIWSTCNIAFEIGEYVAVDPTQYGLNYTITSSNELDTIRSKFDTADMLLGVTAGPWQISANAWTNMPGATYAGAVFDGSIEDYGPIYAHEFGHYLGLDHVSDTSNVMTPVIYSTSLNLTSDQCATARNTVSSYWTKMMR